MKRIISIAICFLILLSCQLPVQASSGVPQEVMDATKSVVRILAEHKKESYTGSGFVIKNDGNEVLIATNDHVVSDNPDRICIWVGEDRQVDAEIVFTIPSKDICVLRLTELVSLAPLTLSDEPAQHGAAIYAVGYPGAGDVLSDTLAHTSDSATITDGIISAIRTFTIEEGAKPVKLLQVNAAINSGNSGGPLFNTKGEVIGINTYKVNVESQGVFGSVDISELKILLNEYGIVLAANTPETEPLPTETEPLPTETEPLPTEEVIPVEESSNIPVSAIAIVAVLVILTAIVLFKVKSKKQLTLRTYMSNFPQGLSVGEAVAMLLPTAIALRNLHNNGKLHLQVSPDAILISAKGAVLKGPSKNEMDRHCSGFTAPEVYRGTGYGITSDVYSFAALLLFAATGKKPSNSLQQDVLCEEIAALESREPAFGAVVRKAMSFLPQDRTQSLQELIYDISAFHNHEFHIRQPSKEKVPRQQRAHTPLIYNESAEVVKQREEEKAAVAKQMQEEKVAAAKQKQEAKAAIAKQRQEERAAAAKQKQEAKVAAAKQKQEAKAAAKQKQEERAAAAKQKQEVKAAAAKQKQEAKAAIAKQRQEEKAATKPRLAKASKIIIPVICTAAVSVPLLFYIIIPSVQYNKAVSLVSAGRYEEAITQATAPPTEIPTEETQVTVDSYLDNAQGFIDKEDFDSAIAVLEQAKEIAADTRIDDMLTRIDEMRSVPLDVVVSQESPDPEGGTVQIHSVTAVQRHDGFVRYTIDYTATEGMYIQLEGPRLSYNSNFSTTGTRDTFEFEISTSDLRAIGRKFRLFFSISRNDLLCLSLLTNWPGDVLTAAIPLPLQQGDLTPIYGCEIHWVTVQAVDEERLYYSVDYTAPRAGMPISVQLGDQEPTVLFHTDTGRRQFAFVLEREDVKAADRILLRIQEGSNSGASVDLGDHTLPEKENSTPVKEISNLPFFINKRLSDGESYQIHNISAQLLASGFVRYSIEYTAREGITSRAYSSFSDASKIYPMVIGREASGTAEIYLTIEDLHSFQETICRFSGVHPWEYYEVRIFHIWNNASTEGVPVGDPISLPFDLYGKPKSDAYSFQSCVAQPLSNGYVRLTFSFTAPENRLCVANPQSPSRIFCGTGKQAGKQTVTLDIPTDTSLPGDTLHFCVNVGSYHKTDGEMIVAIDVSDVLGVDVATAKIFVNIVHPQLNTQTAAS